MKVQENISLSELTTMRVGGVARWVLLCESRDDIVAAIDFANERNLPWFVLGGGSNVVASDDYNGVIILNRIKGFEKINYVAYKIGAGENWDETVEKLCTENLSGVECLSLIPGVAGATPVQNVGAYGQDISQTLVELTVFDVRDGQFKTLTNEDCKFTYRDSVFKSQKNRHYIICDITLRLSRQIMKPPFYEALQRYFSERIKSEGIEKGISPSEVRAAVIAIRDSKLPRVEEVPSTGSFFKNPIVSKDFASDIIKKFPDAPYWLMSDGRVKLAAGWLIDRAELKGYENYGFQLYPKNALVITNVANSSAENLAKFKAEIISKVHEKFDIELEQEPESL
ncbi:UDP-N-acetylmuramate dehydrogenase [Candidatus Saccharibacteria bacterium]|nr:UDP-N-acetylmuramate dehydrogenase [Candidatus Saccharibacteria bacterium]